ncbi:hypothetical protein [Pseudomonas viridiflava]|uniref:hypothetical protein n=1 Tax=Pseudomonas viridiflava TaxID=33069 RepID=UPI002EAB72F7|nr:hypothetical protein [Pseudomonas viridiflava]
MEKFNEIIGKSLSVVENKNDALIKFSKLSKSDFEELNDFSEKYKDYFLLSIRTSEGERHCLPYNYDQLIEDTLNLKIQKLVRPGSAVFFSVDGLCQGLKDNLVQRCVTIYLTQAFSEFSSWSCCFKPWCIEEVSYKEKTLSDPRNFIRDSTGGGLVEHLKFWILLKKPATEGLLYKAWQDVASPKSSLIFCSEIWKKDTTLNLIFSGTQKLEIEYSEQGTEKTFDHNTVASCANWILEVERETDIRHNFFSSRIAREYVRKSDRWPDLFNRVAARALDNAKNDYKAHIHSKSSETLKAISELRKTTAEESSKIIDRTHALAATLFRDIAIAIGTISIKIIISKDSQTESLYLLIFSAFWLAASLTITLRSNRSYIIALTKSRYLWSRKVNSIIPMSEFKELSKRPFKDAVSAYNNARTQATFIYIVTIAFMIILALSQSNIAKALKKIMSFFS